VPPKIKIKIKKQDLVSKITQEKRAESVAQVA
jgi:hypothetical protein